MLSFGRLWYGEPNAVANAIGYAKFYSRSHDTVICVYDCGEQRDCDARAQGRFQGVVGLDSFTDCSVPLVVRLASIARENYTRR